MPSISENELLTIPVVVDDPAGESEGIDLTANRLIRCVYFAIDVSDPSPNWTLGYERLAVSFFMLGLSGIIFTPARTDESNQPEFNDPGDIDRTFNLIESCRSLS